MTISKLYPFSPEKSGRISRTVRFILFAAITGCSHTILVAQDSPAPSEPKFNKQFKEIFLNDATEYSIYRDAALSEKLELRTEPVYLWTNVLREQYGSVFVWTWHGRPEVIASIFSQPEPAGERAFIHEFHTLSTATLVVKRASPHQWQPKTGVKRIPIPGAPKPAENARLRLVQMRELSKEFSAKSVNRENEPWELRLLTQPLYRYQSTDPEIVDGGLFAFVTSAGTDPEVILVLEDAVSGSEAAWNYAICRFSDLNLHVSHKDKEIWSSIRSDQNVLEHDEKHLYRLIGDRRVKDEFKGK